MNILFPRLPLQNKLLICSHHSYHLQIILHHHGLHVLREVFAEALLVTGGGREGGGAGDILMMMGLCVKASTRQEWLDIIMSNKRVVSIVFISVAKLVSGNPHGVGVINIAGMVLPVTGSCNGT